MFGIYIQCQVPYKLQPYTPYTPLNEASLEGYQTCIKVAEQTTKTRNQEYPHTSTQNSITPNFPIISMMSLRRRRVPGPFVQPSAIIFLQGVPIFLHPTIGWTTSLQHIGSNRLQQSLTWLQNHPFVDGHSISISFPRNGGFSIASYLKWPWPCHHPIGFQSATPLVCCVSGVCELSPLQAVSSCSELSCTCRYLEDCNCREHIPKMWLTCLAGSWGINNDLQDFSRICDTRVINWKNNGIGAQIRKPINPL